MFPAYRLPAFWAARIGWERLRRCIPSFVFISVEEGDMVDQVE